jgi:hypothetical protein
MLAVHTEGVRDAHRHDSCRARQEYEPLLARTERQPPLLHDVADRGSEWPQIAI